MAIIISGGPNGNQSQFAVGSNIPTGAVDGAEWSRVEPIITPDQLRIRQLLGIPLMSALPDPITGKRFVVTDDILKDQVIRACSKFELESGITVLPVQYQLKLPFDRNEFLSFGFMQVPPRPILSIQDLSVVTANGSSVYTVPLEWVDPGGFQRGQVTIIPLQPAFLSSGYLPSQTAGGAAFLSILGQKGWVPSYWMLTFVAGFAEGKFPIVMNEVIGCYAAIEVLSALAATYRISSHSQGLDGMSQSVSGPGPQIYEARIKELEETKNKLIQKAKALFVLKLFTSNV